MIHRPHGHLGATYRLITQAAGDAFAVEVTVPGMALATVSGFTTEAGAERWIAGHRATVAAGRAVRRTFRMSNPKPTT